MKFFQNIQYIHFTFIFIVDGLVNTFVTILLSIILKFEIWGSKRRLTKSQLRFNNNDIFHILPTLYPTAPVAIAVSDGRGCPCQCHCAKHTHALQWPVSRCSRRESGRTHAIFCLGTPVIARVTPAWRRVHTDLSSAAAPNPRNIHVISSLNSHVLALSSPRQLVLIRSDLFVGRWHLLKFHRSSGSYTAADGKIRDLGEFSDTSSRD